MARANWSVPTSPRSPYKIRDELILLSKFEDKKWDKSAQAEFGKLLGGSEFFEGDVPSTPDWVGRARFGTIKFWGFVYKDDDDRVKITSAGKRLIEGRRQDEIFTKQLVKWQYPDNQHGGGNYPLTRYGLHPFLATLRILKETKTLTKDEIAIFLFLTTQDSQVPQVSRQVLEFRHRLSRLKGSVKKKEFILKTVLGQIKRNFGEEYNTAIGRTQQTTLGRKKASETKATQRAVESLVIRHKNTFYDYADALIRYVRYTQLLSVEGYKHTLVVNPTAEKKVEALAKIDAEIHPYEDARDFYENYYGSSEVPTLPYENVEMLSAIAQEWLETARDLAQRLRKVAPTIPVPKIVVPEKLPTDVAGLKKVEDDLRQQVRAIGKNLMAIELQSREKLVEVCDLFKPIASGDVVDPPAFLEWNTWRAFESLDAAKEVKPFFLFQDDMQPANPAPGNVPDLKVVYDDFVLVPEVTLKTGAVQWRDEAEPVPVHVIRIQKDNPKLTVFGVFIAPKIDDRTRNVFYGAKTTPDMFGDFVNVIPLTLDQFEGILRFFAENYFRPQMLYDLMTRLDKARDTVSSLPKDKGVAWVDSFPSAIEEWKKNVATVT